MTASRRAAVFVPCDASSRSLAFSGAAIVRRAGGLADAQNSVDRRSRSRPVRRRLHGQIRAHTRSDRRPPSPEPEVGTRIGVWRQPAGLTQTPIWPGVAPDQAGVEQPPESILTKSTPEAIGGATSQAAFDVARPDHDGLPAQGPQHGRGDRRLPRRGFQILALTIEGTEICDWITSKGITCILSKYASRHEPSLGQDLPLRRHARGPARPSGRPAHHPPGPRPRRRPAGRSEQDRRHGLLAPAAIWSP